MVTQLSEFSSVDEMMTDVGSPTKLIHEGLVALHVDQTESTASEGGVGPTPGAFDVELSVRFAEVEHPGSGDLPEGLDPELAAEIMAEMAELGTMNDLVELIWIGRAPHLGWKQTQQIVLSDLMGLESSRAIDWIWWSDAPAPWQRAFQQEMILRGAQQSFDDDTVVLSRVIGDELVDLRFKYIAPCMDWAILREGAEGDAVLVRMRGLAADEELPPIVGCVSIAGLLGYQAEV